LKDSGLVLASVRKALDRFENEEASEPQLRRSLATIAGALAAHHGKRAIILIDEYDSPFNHKDQDAFRDKLLIKMSSFSAQCSKATAM
jgi:hypothetical protein